MLQKGLYMVVSDSWTCLCVVELVQLLCDGECLESRETDSTQSTLMSLVDSLPFHHRATLHFLMTHLCRVCRLQVEAGHHESLNSLCLVFCHILLRPAWEKIV